MRITRARTIRILGVELLLASGVLLLFAPDASLMIGGAPVHERDMLRWIGLFLGIEAPLWALSYTWGLGTHVRRHIAIALPLIAYLATAHPVALLVTLASAMGILARTAGETAFEFHDRFLRARSHNHRRIPSF